MLETVSVRESDPRRVRLQEPSKRRAPRISVPHSGLAQYPHAMVDALEIRGVAEIDAQSGQLTVARSLSTV